MSPPNPVRWEGMQVNGSKLSVEGLQSLHRGLAVKRLQVVFFFLGSWLVVGCLDGSELPNTVTNSDEFQLDCWERLSTFNIIQQ